MSAIRRHDTDIEQRVEAILRANRLRFSRQRRDLPGRPDFVVGAARVAIFVDGDFWHGFRFPSWGSGLAPVWQAKILANRARDARNHGALRRRGWTVVRIWGHELRREEARVSRKIRASVRRGERRLKRAPIPRLRSGGG